MVVASGKVSEGAERSLTVHYANYKEDIILKKNLDIINRTEKNIVHRVKIDQKMLYKRFQDKLHRSKLAYARMYGDKEKERELRAKNLRSLNINVGDSEQDYEFLKKLQSSDMEKSRKVPKVKVSSNVDTIIDDVFVPDRTPRARSRSLSEGSISAAPTVSNAARNIAKRPSSAKYGRTRETTPSGKNGDRLKVPSIDIRPQTCTPKLQALNEKHRSPRPSNSERTPRKSSNLFESEERTDYVEMRLKELKSVDYTDKIDQFCESISDYRSTGNGATDYYTMHQDTIPKVKIIDDLPGTPDEQYQKHYGNLKVKSLTMGRLNFNFSKHDSSQSHLFTPDASAMLRYDSTDDDSDDDDSD